MSKIIEFPKVTLYVFTYGKWKKMLYRRAKTNSEEDVEFTVNELLKGLGTRYPNHRKRYLVTDDSGTDNITLKTAFI